ncbi:hypothetical protein LOZ58_005172 [Ophidiomyces ophidiicola]|nr:hypothetical protein LOZ65_005654 [Ophidiomyces ophidiicola]KAI1935116.1 hypothetical protein LOZ66_005422 [Ophidiomyces ophidiicola]KAI1958439.1 hypothetical protein LOZ58_005172 [Ophidiomyces ophidiicola]
MVDNTTLFDKLDDLADLEIAILLCLVAREHGIIDTDADHLDDLENELSLIVENTFKLSKAVVDCSPGTSWEEFSNAILIPRRDAYANQQLQSSHSKLNVDVQRESGSFHSERAFREQHGSRNKDERTLVNVVIAKNLNQAPETVQIQVLELIQSKRILIKALVYNAPEIFLLVPLLSTSRKPLSTLLNKHLNDHIYLSHHHDRADCFPNLEKASDWISDEAASEASVLRRAPSSPRSFQKSYITKEDIDILQQLSNNVSTSADVNCYLQNFVVFLRLHRGVAGGVSPVATRYFRLLARCLAAFQHLDLLIPSLIAIAAKKTYRHRIIVAGPRDDRSLLYESSLEAAKYVLTGLTPEDIIEETLVEVEAPL